MSTLYLGTHEETLAQKLAKVLDEAGQSGDWFAPSTVVAPNPYVAKWLRLWLARETGVVMNVRIAFRLEDLMWQLLKEVDGRSPSQPLTLVTEDQYRLMVLAGLLAKENKEGDPFRAYLGRPGQERSRDFWRRAWQLAGLLANLIRDYEYHRQDDLIQKWLIHKDGYPQARPEALALERGQRELFEQIVREPDGLRARLQKALKTSAKTLPQYANEVMELSPEQLRANDNSLPIHLFGLTQISALHVRTLRWLGERYDMRVYHLNPLAGRLEKLPAASRQGGEALQVLTDRFRQSPLLKKQPTQPGEDLVKAWGQAGAEALWLMAELLEGDRPFAMEVVPPLRSWDRPCVLQRVQECLTQLYPVDEGPLPQDCSLQLVACAGIYREVETVYQSILHNLQENPGLKQSDIAVLATDMAAYRPVIQAVFERAPQFVRYTLGDYSAAELSSFGHAVMGLLDLALESFTRSRVLSVLTNPCFLAQLGVDREQAQMWPRWVEALSIYHGWDREDRKERGYSDSPLYSWQHGLRRLRLGRLMNVPGDYEEGPPPRFGDVIPYSDLECGEADNLEAFVRAVDPLLPRLASLRGLSASGSRWGKELRGLIEEFLAIPHDQPAEKQVRDALLESFERLELLDSLHEEKAGSALPLALIREYVQESLETLKARKGDSLTAGVTVSSLKALLPVPFQIIYVVGLGEGLFPGSDRLPSLDLRGRKHCAGDILPAEANRFHFLQALTAARAKVYLLYNCRDLQKDQEFHPSSPINQLRRFLSDHVTADKDFKIAKAPLLRNDIRLLAATDPERPFDVFVNYSEKDRLLALAEARHRREINLTPKQSKEIDERLKDATKSFTVPSEPKPVSEKDLTISLSTLRGFLHCPAESVLKRHLGLFDDEEVEPADAEPFYTGPLVASQLMKAAQKRFVSAAIATSLDEAQKNWRQRFRILYDEWRLRGRTPDGAFGQINQARLEQQLQGCLEGPTGLVEFLKARKQAQFCGPVLLGESAAPIHPRCRLPAVKLDGAPSDGQPSFQVCLTGSLPLVWRSPEAIDVLVPGNKDEDKVPADQLSAPLLEPALFYLALRSRLHQTDSSSNDWLGDRIFRVHLTHAAGTHCIPFQPEDFSPESAADYLAALARDFLDRSSFDLLPFALIKGKDLRAAYQAPSPEWPADKQRKYVRMIEEAYEEDQEKPMGRMYYPMNLLQIVQPHVPEDALEKVQRRFRLLDRGPKRNR